MPESRKSALEKIGVTPNSCSPMRSAAANDCKEVADTVEGFLILGFLIGLGHTMEADHLAAVTAMSAGRPGSKSKLAVRSAFWGLGHTIMLLAICLTSIFLGLTLTRELAAALELGVGVMLVLLGVNVICRTRTRRLHVHAHDHGDGRRHIHVHSHQGASVAHPDDPHVHEHANGFPVRALIVGLVHGAAGSAGLLALIAATYSLWMAALYILLFGIGSILGMIALTLVASWPLSWLNTGVARFHLAINLAVGAMAILIGGNLLIENGPVAGFVF